MAEASTSGAALPSANKRPKIWRPNPTLRISHIPKDISSEQFLGILETLVYTKTPEQEINGKKIIHSSFAPSAISADAEKECVATVTFREIPPVLAVRKQIDLQGPGGLFSVAVDSHFLGITPLNNPIKEITVDIIAVTGLAGHAFGSWKTRNEATMWLRDFLPQHVPTARILTYGYNSQLLESQSNASIREFSGTFLETLKTVRVLEKEKHRPIIFIGHSLGGLVIKQALVKAANGSEQDKRIFLACYGILFFGVPNRGLNVDALRSMVKGHPNSRLVEDLDPKSECLHLLHEAFCNNFKFEDSPLISIHETKFTKTVVLSQEGIWQKTGPMVLMVPEASATYSGPTEKRYDQLSIDADHSDIVKFSDCNNPSYLIVRQRIVELVQRAPGVIGGRFKPKLQANLLSHTTHLNNRIKKLLSPTEFETDTIYRDFMHCEGTGDWLLSRPEFIRWRDMVSSETIWLHGIPGCGKTYLMSMVLKHIKRHCQKNTGIIYFFCDNKTESSERQSFPSIVKTLVSQLLVQIPPSYLDDVERCLQLFENLTDKEKMIRLLFRDALKSASKCFSSLFLILDGLDECDDVASLLGLLKDTKNIPSMGCRIILASRDIDHIRNLLRNTSVQSIPVSQSQIKNDVETFIRKEVQDLDIRDFGSGDEATKHLINGSDSLFLLAHFRVESLKRSRLYTHQDLEKALSDLPEDLTRFYDHTLKSLENLPDLHRETVRKVFMWVIYAKRKLNFCELVEAVSAPRGNGIYHPYQQKLTRRGLDELCRGLLVFKSQDNSDTTSTPELVEIAHSTVKDYIFDFVWSTTAPVPLLRDKNICHSEIVSVALAYMSNLQDQRQADTYPLLDYVCESWIRHLFDLDKPSSQFMTHLSEFLDSEICFLWWDSPKSERTRKDEYYLQTQFHGWITTNVPKEHRLYHCIYFMITQQEKQVSHSRQRNGNDHVSTLATVHSLALTYRDQGRLKEAEDLLVQVVATRKRVLGKDHPDTLTTVHNLALTYWDQRRLKEAEDLFVQVVATRKRVLGEDHPHTLTAVHNLALTYRDQRRLKEAEDLFVQVVATRKRVLGEDHPHVLTTVHSLALMYRVQGRLKEAEDLLVQVVATLKRVLGKDHPHTLTTVHNLALTYRDQGRLKEAEDLFVQVVATRKRVLGEDHPDTLITVHHLALTYRDQGRLKKAEDLFVQVVATRKRVLGEDHPDTLATVHNLAWTYRDQGRLKEAEDLFVQVVATQKRVLGEDHPHTLTTAHNLAWTYRDQGRLKEAEDLFVQVVATRKRVLGEDHPHTLTTAHSLALTYRDQGRLKEAEDLLVQVVATQKRVLGEDRPDTLASLHRLEYIYKQRRSQDKADTLPNEAVKRSITALSEDDCETAKRRKMPQGWL